MDTTKDNAPATVDAKAEPRPAPFTLRGYAERAGLEPWTLAALCAVTKHAADDAIAPEVIANAVAFLNGMSLGG
jgi:hypothetical protein